MAKTVHKINHLKTAVWRNRIYAGLVFLPMLYHWAAVFLSLPLAVFFLRRARILEGGAKGEDETGRVLKKLPDGYTILGDLTVKTQGREAQLDHVVVGPAGVFIIETKNMKGRICGKDGDQEITQEKRNEKGQLITVRSYNPIKQVSTHVRRLEEILQEAKLRIPVKGAVFFTHPQVDVQIATRTIPVFTLNRDQGEGLLRYLQNPGKGRLLSHEECQRVVKTIRKSA